MWPYFNVPLEGNIRQVWLYYYLRWYGIYHNCCPVHISFIIWLIVTDYLCHKWSRVCSSVSQMTTSMFLCVTNDHEYVPLCHKWPRVCSSVSQITTSMFLLSQLQSAPLHTDRPEYSWKIARWTLNNNQSINQPLHTAQKTKDWATRIPLKTQGEPRCSGKESSSCSTCGTCCVTLLSTS